MAFPNTFAENVQLLEPNIGERGNAALTRLNEKRFVVAHGLTRYFAGAVGIMGQQPHIREYCPKDPTSARFSSEESAERWLKKGGGRAMFLLLSQVVEKDEVLGQQLEGYGWTGKEHCDARPNHPVTSAYRIGANAKGKRLAGDFIQAVVSGTHSLYAQDEGIGLETWQSNHAAKLYSKVGFVLQPQTDQESELRPTLDPNATDGTVEDTRLHMGYPNELLN